MAKILCMEVGTSIVRLAEAIKIGNEVKITKTFVFDTPDDATKDGKVRVSDSIVSAIRNGIDESGIKATDVYFAVESTKILFKQIEMPYIPKRLIKSTLELQFADLFQVEETLYHVSYVHEKTYEKNGKQMMSVAVFAVPNDLSESYYNLAIALGLTAKGLSSTSRGMLNLFPDSFKNRNVAMVNINEKTSTLSITLDGNMVFNKTIPYGIDNTIRRVMNSPLTMDDIDTTRAAEFLYTQNILLKQKPDGINDENDEQEMLHYETTNSVVSLVRAIEQSFAAFLSKENIHIQEFHLTGLGAGFAGISQLLTSEFGIQVKVMQQDGNLKIHQHAADDIMLLSCYPCVGSAIDKANFFTKAEKVGGEIAQRKRMDKRFVLVSTLICLASVVYSAFSWMNADLHYKSVYDEHAILEEKVQFLRDQGIEIKYNNYMTAVSYNKNVVSLYNETKSNNEDMTVFLLGLEKTLPSSARVTAITISPESATASFTCKNKLVAAGVLHLLRNMPTIQVNGMNCPGVSENEKTGEVTFRCTFTLKHNLNKDQIDWNRGGNR